MTSTYRDDIKSYFDTHGEKVDGGDSKVPLEKLLEFINDLTKKHHSFYVSYLDKQRLYSFVNDYPDKIKIDIETFNELLGDVSGWVDRMRNGHNVFPSANLEKGDYEYRHASGGAGVLKKEDLLDVSIDKNSKTPLKNRSSVQSLFGDKENNEFFVSGLNTKQAFGEKDGSSYADLVFYIQKLVKEKNELLKKIYEIEVKYSNEMQSRVSTINSLLGSISSYNSTEQHDETMHSNKKKIKDSIEDMRKRKDFYSSRLNSINKKLLICQDHEKVFLKMLSEKDDQMKSCKEEIETIDDKNNQIIKGIRDITDEIKNMDEKCDFQIEDPDATMDLRKDFVLPGFSRSFRESLNQIKELTSERRNDLVELNDLIKTIRNSKMHYKTSKTSRGECVETDSNMINKGTLLMAEMLNLKSDQQSVLEKKIELLEKMVSESQSAKKQSPGMGGITPSFIIMSAVCLFMAWFSLEYYSWTSQFVDV